MAFWKSCPCGETYLYDGTCHTYCDACGRKHYRLSTLDDVQKWLESQPPLYRLEFGRDENGWWAVFHVEGLPDQGVSRGEPSLVAAINRAIERMEVEVVETCCVDLSFPVPDRVL